MRHSHQCPKCNSIDVITIVGNRYNQTQIIGLSKWGGTNAVLDRYICAHCGYTEEWVQLDKKFNSWVEKNRKDGKLPSDFV